jgi:hypothetical protein
VHLFVRQAVARDEMAQDVNVDVHAPPDFPAEYVRYGRLAHARRAVDDDYFSPIHDVCPEKIKPPGHFLPPGYQGTKNLNGTEDFKM